MVARVDLADRALETAEPITSVVAQELHGLVAVVVAAEQEAQPVVQVVQVSLLSPSTFYHR